MLAIETVRVNKGLESTKGELWINGRHWILNSKGVYVLEDADRGLTWKMSEAEIAKVKIYAQTAIPTTAPGKPYLVKLTKSTKFGGRMWPELLNVPGYGGIRPHAGNYIKDTEGCQLPGILPDQDRYLIWRVWDSRNTYAALLALINKELFSGGTVTWGIRQAY